jgi:hypothetical protein
MSTRKLSPAVALLLGTSLPPVISPAAACTASHIRVGLIGFEPEGSTRFAYIVAETEPQKAFTVYAGGDACGETVHVTYATGGGTATPGEDYQPVSPKQASMYLPFHGDASVVDEVTIVNNSTPPDAHVESIDVVLSNPVNASLANTATAPILIIDDEGAARVGFEGVPYSQSESVASVRIPVFRAGPAPGSASVNFALSPAGPSPATPGEDVTGAATGTLTFSPNDRLEAIDLGIVNDQTGEGDETFTLSLSGATGADIVAGQMTFTVLDNEEGAVPSSRLHHPRHKWRYKKSDYRIREVHIFTTDNPGGSGVAAAHFALRRNMKNGDCLWLTTSGWQKKDCQSREWLDTHYDSVGQLWRFRLKQLRSSVGTRIKSYTAFSRAIDGANNVENDFAEKRNSNTFEIKRSRKPRR